MDVNVEILTYNPGDLVLGIFIKEIFLALSPRKMVVLPNSNIKETVVPLT